MSENLKPLAKCCDQYSHELANLERVSIDRIVKIADEVGSFLVKGKYLKNNKPDSMGIKVSQIRRFLDAVRRIEARLKKGDLKKSRVHISSAQACLCRRGGKRQNRSIRLDRPSSPGRVSGEFRKSSCGY